MDTEDREPLRPEPEPRTRSPPEKTRRELDELGLGVTRGRDPGDRGSPSCARKGFANAPPPGSTDLTKLSDGIPNAMVAPALGHRPDPAQTVTTRPAGHRDAEEGEETAAVR